MFTTISTLNRNFGIPHQLRFEQGPGGMLMAAISNDLADATVFLQGAHLAGWTPRGQEPVIWLSPKARFAAGAPIRGGVPVCWPWFGSHPGDSGLPAHGFARTSAWEMLESARLDDGSTRVRMQLIPADRERASWPHSASAEILLTVGRTLEIELTTRNLGGEFLKLTQALHAYFRVGDVRLIKVFGLDGCPYIDKTDGGRRKTQDGPVTVASEVDRIYLDSAGDCLIVDPVLARRIGIAKSGSASTIVWNPWMEKAADMADLGEGDYIDMICVETANAADDEAVIAPGDEHRLKAVYRVESD